VVSGHLPQEVKHRFESCLDYKLKVKTMPVLIMVIIVVVMFAWAMPQEEIDELNKRLGIKK